jgi:hypothetical protein
VGLKSLKSLNLTNGYPNNYKNNKVKSKPLELRSRVKKVIYFYLGNPRIDVFSLDIEGAELQVLETLPFDKVDISVIMIEVNHVGEIFEGDNDALRRLLGKNGYIFYKRVAIDDIYVKKSFLDVPEQVKSSQS